MEFNIESILNNADQFRVKLSKAKVQSEVKETKYILDVNSERIGMSVTYKDGTTAVSCLICLTHMVKDFADHVVNCQKRIGNDRFCQVCCVSGDESHVYSNSHALQIAKMRTIATNKCQVGFTKGGEFVIDTTGPNISYTEVVYHLETRLNNCKNPEPGGLATYHLKAALLAAASSNSNSKKLAENSTVVQMLLQVAVIASNGHVPCPTAAKITYALNGYSVIEMIGALHSIYPEDYPYTFITKQCYMHMATEKTIQFRSPSRTYDHIAGLLGTLTGKNFPKFSFPVQAKMDTNDGMTKVTKK